MRRLFGLNRRALTVENAGVLVSSGIGNFRIDPIPYGSLAYRVPVVWGCVKMIADRLISLPRVVLQGNGQPTAPPKWLEQPNDWTDGDQMLSKAVFGFLLNGNFYAVVHRERYGGPIRKVIIPNPWEVECDWDYRSKIVRWWWNGVDYTSDTQAVVSMAHQAYLTEGNQVVGVGPGRAISLAGDLLNQAYRFMLAEFANNITGNVVVEYPGEITDDEAKRVRGQLLAHAVGPSNARKPLVASGGASVKSLGGSAKDAQFVEQVGYFNGVVAGQVFNVDPPLLGVNASGVSLTYNNQQEREEKLWEDALRPVAHRYQQFVSRLLPRPRKLKLDESTLTGVTRAHTLDNVLKEIEVNLKAGVELIPWEKIAERAGGKISAEDLAKLKAGGGGGGTADALTDELEDDGDAGATADDA